MDTSETYIKMCEKAEEIQALKPEYGPNWEREFHSWNKDGIPIWLPRQDQLQEMVVEQGKLAGHFITELLIAKLMEFYDSLASKYYYANSMEALWLAFVMKAKYNKIWHGEDWVNAKVSSLLPF